MFFCFLFGSSVLQKVLFNNFPPLFLLLLLLYFLSFKKNFFPFYSKTVEESTVLSAFSQLLKNDLNHYIVIPSARRSPSTRERSIDWVRVKPFVIDRLCCASALSSSTFAIYTAKKYHWHNFFSSLFLWESHPPISVGIELLHYANNLRKRSEQPFLTWPITPLMPSVRFSPLAKHIISHVHCIYLLVYIDIYFTF